MRTNLANLLSTVLTSAILASASFALTGNLRPLATFPAAQLRSDTLTITCPPGFKDFCSQPNDPSAAGQPTATGGCLPYTFTYVDVDGPPSSCPAGRFSRVVTRTWTVTDGCGDSASCDQVLHLLKDLVFLDLHPRSCPNPLRRNQNGKYPAAILGTANFDVTTIVPGSLQLYVRDCQGGGSLAPIPSMTGYEDVAAPYTGGEKCGCTTNGPDGYLDLIFKFDRGTMVQALGLGSYPAFTNVELVIVGDLTNGCSFFGTDCVRVQ